MSELEASSGSSLPRRASHPSARRRLGMVAILYGYRSIGALLLAAPIAVFASELTGAHPRGDAVLFDPGGLMLSEAARLARSLYAPLAVQGALLGLVIAFVGLLPLAALIAALGRDGRLSARFLAERAADSIGTLTLLWGAALVAQVVLAVLFVLVGEKALELADLSLRSGDIARLALLGVGLMAVAALGVVHDLARVAVVHDGQRFYMASARALRALFQAWGHIGWAYAWRGALTLGSLAAAIGLSYRLGTEDGLRFGLGAAAHQAAIALSVLLRASWLAAAIGILERQAPLALRESFGAEEPRLQAALSEVLDAEASTVGATSDARDG